MIDAMMPIAAVVAVLALCVSGLVAWAWWLAHAERIVSRQLVEAQAKRNVDDTAIRAAVGRIEEWERRLVKAEMGRAFK